MLSRCIPRNAVNPANAIGPPSSSAGAPSGAANPALTHSINCCWVHTFEHSISVPGVRKKKKVHPLGAPLGAVSPDSVHSI
jgi:hypothetical protein